MPHENSLHVYSSGGVAPPLKDCAEQFRAMSATEFEFTVGKAEDLMSRIEETKQGDSLTCGAEHVLDEAQVRGLILGETRKSVGYRRSAILVPKGNPRKTTSISDLAVEGVKVGVSYEGCLLGVWDDVASSASLTEEIRENITDFAEGADQ